MIVPLKGTLVQPRVGIGTNIKRKELAVQTLGLKPGSFSRVFPRENLIAPLGFCLELFSVSRGSYSSAQLNK